MARFNTYSQIMSSNKASSADEEEIITSDEAEFSEPVAIVEQVPELPELAPEFVDLNYWKSPINDDLTDLLTDYE